MTEKFDGAEKHAILAETIKQIRKAIVMTDLAYRILFANNAFVGIYGYSREKPISLYIFLLWPKNTQPDSLEKIRQSTPSGHWQGELVYRRKNEKEFPIALFTSTVYNERNEPIALIGIVTDITDQKLKNSTENRMRKSYVASNGWSRSIPWPAASSVKSIIS